MNLGEMAKGAAKATINKYKKAILAKVLPILIPVVFFALILVAVIMGASGAEVDAEESELMNGMSSSSTSSWEQFLKYLHQAEGGGNITKNSAGEDCYTVQPDGGGGSAVGYGVDIATHGSKIRSAGYSTNIGSLIPVSVVDPIEKEEVEDRYNDIKKLASSNGVNLTEYQIFALVSRTYNYGFAGGTGQATSSFQYPSNLTFVQAYKQYYTSIDNDDYYGDYTKTNFENGLYTQYMTALKYVSGGQPSGWVTRRQSEWCLFQTGYYGWGLKNGGKYPEGFDEYWQKSYGGANFKNKEFNNNIDLYNSDGSVNKEKKDELDTYLTNLLHTVHHRSNSAQQGGPFPKWWQSNYNNLERFQCTWWAYGRASQYLELTGNKYSKYPIAKDRIIRKWS